MQTNLMQCAVYGLRSAHWPPPNPLTSAAMLAALLLLFSKDNLWIWRSAWLEAEHDPLSSETLFQHNDPKQTSKTTTSLLKKLRVNMIDWLSMPPDLNPIEHPKTEGGGVQGLWHPSAPWCPQGRVDEDSSGNLWSSGELMNWCPRGLRQCWKTMVATQNINTLGPIWTFSLTFGASDLDINGCVLSDFEGTVHLHCYTSCALTTLHCIKVSILQGCAMNRFNKIFPKMWGVYSLLWDIAYSKTKIKMKENKHDNTCIIKILWKLFRI